MSTEQNKRIAHRVYAELINQSHKELIDELYAPDVIIHDPFMGTVAGIEAFRQLLATFDTAFPGHTVQVEQLIAEDEWVTVLHTHTATHTGSFLEMPPTSKTVIVHGVEVMRIRNGKIVEFWRHDDDAGLLMQLGVIPAPAAA